MSFDFARLNQWQRDDGLLLLISKYGSHINVPTLLPRKVLNKQQFSINKSLKDINFYFCFWDFFSRDFIQTFFFISALFCLPSFETWFAGIEMESMNGLMAKPVYGESESPCNKKVDEFYDFFAAFCRHSWSRPTRKKLHINTHALSMIAEGHKRVHQLHDMLSNIIDCLIALH